MNKETQSYVLPPILCQGQIRCLLCLRIYILFREVESGIWQCSHNGSPYRQSCTWSFPVFGCVGSRVMLVLVWCRSTGREIGGMA